MTTLTELVVTFTEADAGPLHQPHNETLVVSLVIANIKVYWILVDGGSFVDVLSLHVFNAMKLGRDRLKCRPTPLVGFGGQVVSPEGSIELPITLGEGRNYTTMMVEFLVVNDGSTYNSILGRPTIHQLKAVPSTYHQVMKFPTSSGVGIVGGEQLVSRECYQTALKETVSRNMFVVSLPTNTISHITGEDEGHLDTSTPVVENNNDNSESIPNDDVKKQGEPFEPLEIVTLLSENQKVSIGTRLRVDERERLIAFLRSNTDIFS